MDEEDKPEPKTNLRSIIAIGVTCLLGWVFTYLTISIYRNYATGLFIWLPFVMGATSTMIYGFRSIITKRKAFKVSLSTLSIYSFGLLLFAWEGLGCIIMALPLGFFFMWLGHLLGFELAKRNPEGAATIIIFFISTPLLMAFENQKPDKEKIRSVTTSIEIDATPEEIWQYVIAFPPLKDPTEFIFKAGIAYPTDATINGRGIGAVRHCNFSTGAFVEPITKWEEPRLLRFAVNNQPEPMKEFSFYDTHPNHLQGYWVCKQGEFKLITLSNGKTLLEGTTWYVNKIKPYFYWAMWSDYFVHKIHKRVLKHIKILAEKPN